MVHTEKISINGLGINGALPISYIFWCHTCLLYMVEGVFWDTDTNDRQKTLWKSSKENTEIKGPESTAPVPESSVPEFTNNRTSGTDPLRTLHSSSKTFLVLIMDRTEKFGKTERRKVCFMTINRFQTNLYHFSVVYAPSG